LELAFDVPCTVVVVVVVVVVAFGRKFRADTATTCRALILCAYFIACALFFYVARIVVIVIITPRARHSLTTDATRRDERCQRRKMPST
jgi:hypothetical protein